jgi:Kdo2-lipid IVA lauroyltransferase/acyltransferase
MRSQIGIAKALSQLPFAARWKLARWLAKSQLASQPLHTEAIVANLTACWPDLSPPEVAALAVRSGQEQCFNQISLLRYWGWSAAELQAHVQLRNEEVVRQLHGQTPLVMVCAHMTGIEVAIQRLALEGSAVSLVRPSKHPQLEALRERARNRYHPQHSFDIRQPLTPAVRLVARKVPLFLLPDLDCATPAALFPTFFGVRAATTPTTAWLAKKLHATVLPVSTRRTEADHFEVSFGAPLSLANGALTGDALADTQHINDVLQAQIQAVPEQYLWSRPRFATRPPNETAMYSDALLAQASQQYGFAR